MLFEMENKLLSEEYFRYIQDFNSVKIIFISRGMKEHLNLVNLGEDKENKIVDCPPELKNFLESELNLEEYEPINKELEEKKKGVSLK